MQQVKIQEIELIPVYPGKNSILMAYFDIPVGAFFPNLPFSDFWLMGCDTQTAEFINLEPLKMILRINGVETLKVEDGKVWIWKGMLFSWREIFLKIEAIFRQEISKGISFTIGAISSGIEAEKAIVTMTEGNTINCCFKKRASTIYCYAKKENNKVSSSFTLDLGESLIRTLLMSEWVEDIHLMPYILRIITNRNTPNIEKEKIINEIERIIEEYNDNGKFMAI